MAAVPSSIRISLQEIRSSVLQKFKFVHNGAPAVLAGLAVLVIIVMAGGALAGGTQIRDPKLTFLHRFLGGADGANPDTGLVADKTGILYGTTLYGGGGSGCFNGCGTVFDLVPPAHPGGASTHNVLYSFTGSDAVNPDSPLTLDAAGNLYGTAPSFRGGGVVFQLAPPAVQGGSWTETVVHTFVIDTSDGWNPVGKLVFDQQGNLYGGTTYGGGLRGAGTIYQLAPPAQIGGPWTETLLYVFTGGNDGANPEGGPGPCTDSEHRIGCGTVFELLPHGTPGGAWTETVIYDFLGHQDEYSPSSELVFDRQGNLYGISILTVYELSPPAGGVGPWTETTLHTFPGGITGTNPSAAVVFDKAGNLYGNAYAFGLDGTGWIYELTPPGAPGGSWTETTLFTFPGGFNSANPYGSLVVGKGGALYGTTYAGGNNNQGTVLVLAFHP
jgi:uncharacterized repeat protein (TIGR03803 family)